MTTSAAPVVAAAADDAAAAADVGSFPASAAGAYPRPFTRDWSKVDRAVSPARVAELRREGWTVIDNFLQGGGGGGGGVGGGSGGVGGGSGDEEGGGGGDDDDDDDDDGGAWALALREEIKWLATTGLMRPNRTHFANPKARFVRPHFPIPIHFTYPPTDFHKAARFHSSVSWASPRTADVSNRIIMDRAYSHLAQVDSEYANEWTTTLFKGGGEGGFRERRVASS